MRAFQLLIILFSCSFLFNPGGSVTDPTDVAALAAFKKGLHDPHSKLSDWRGSDPCSDEWEGIICAPDANMVYHVTEIHLINSNLSGILAPELGSLSSLKSLDLTQNKLTGPIPSSIGNLTSLETLLVDSNSITGPLPSELGKLSNMIRLQVDDNQITGPIPPEFGQLLNAKHLHMSNNKLSGSIPELGRLRLLHLLLDNNRLSGNLPSDLSNISTLQVMQLDNNAFDEQEFPAAYLNMTKLLQLSLSNCSLKGSFPNLNRLTVLKVVDLSYNYFSGSLPINFTISHNATLIDFSNNNLNGEIPPVLVQSESLQLLSLKNNQFEGSLLPIVLVADLQERENNNALILDFQNNSLVWPKNQTLTVKDNVELWLYGNKGICTTNLQPYCAPYTLIDDGSNLHRNNPKCPDDICNPEVDEIVPGLSAEGNCKCASPIKADILLRIPQFTNFEPYVRQYEEFMSFGLQLTVYQLSVASYQWQRPKLEIHMKIFPTMVDRKSRTFNHTEVMRIFLSFTHWTAPDSPFFGPRELLDYVPPYGQALFGNQKSGLTKHVKASYVGIIVGVAIGTALVCLALIFFILRTRNTKKKRTRGFMPIVEGVKCFDLEELISATDNFSDENQIGQGGYGKVYKGVLENGQLVAIKRAQEITLGGAHEFYTEIELLSRLHHRNLVALIGYCLEDDEELLVYEFMCGGTLRNRLSSTEETMSIGSRLEMALGAARGILYLHTEANPPIFHRDIKATNILLDEKNIAKVADFGLSKLAPEPLMDGTVSGHVSTVVKGTPGYLDPEYFMTHKLTDKSDVYSFGVVLLELLTGLQPISRGKNLVREVRFAYDAGIILHVLDSSMGAYPCEVIEPFVRLALTCSNDDPEGRPSMSDVVRDLENLLHAIPNNNSFESSSYYEASTTTTTSRKEFENSKMDNAHNESMERFLVDSSFSENDGAACIGSLVPR